MKKDLISKRYINDGISTFRLNKFQTKYLNLFLNDERIKYYNLDTCPLCMSKEFILIGEKDRYGIPLSTVVCDKCGLIFSLNRMEEESLKVFYSFYYRKIYEGINEENEDILENKFKIRNKRLPKFLKRNDLVVEIGAGGGWNLLKFKNANYETIGFDYGKHYLDFGRKYYGLDLREGGVTEAKNLNIKAKYLLLLEVLEHIDDVNIFLEDFKKILDDYGFAYIKVPSASTLPFLGGGDIGFDLLETLQNAHNFLFDDFTLSYQLSKVGLKIYTLFGGNCIINGKDENSILFEKLNNEIDKKPRGHSVIKYLKFCERTTGLKYRILPRKYITKGYVIYFALKPIQVLKTIMLYKVGLKL